MAIKHCVDCKYCWKKTKAFWLWSTPRVDEDLLEFSKCTYPKAATQNIDWFVTGKDKEATYCKTERRDRCQDDSCGREAKFFEALS